MKLCKDCKWSNVVSIESTGNSQCTSPRIDTVIDPVSGIRKLKPGNYAMCSTQREKAISDLENICGPDAAWFEPRENPPSLG